MYLARLYAVCMKSLTRNTIDKTIELREKRKIEKIIWEFREIEFKRIEST